MADTGSSAYRNVRFRAWYRIDLPSGDRMESAVLQYLLAREHGQQ